MSKVIPTKKAIRIVDAGTVGRAAVAAMDLKAGWTVNVFDGPVVEKPGSHTIQLDEHVHIAPTDGAEYISHKCQDTNSQFMISPDRKTAFVVITADVEQGQPLTFNYNTTEWAMDAPFRCECQSCKDENSPRVIQGHKYLSLMEREEIINATSPYVLEKSAEEALRYVQLVEGLSHPAPQEASGSN
eukprot:CAMPEP_0203755508 /NCGR_PEP_ID=MMETSP0098-20131031/8948_1 /ASSEMBLY_ACC=CAM_ASM_000208 /TAXON_ID=96639 /ORGANISM=" , Strain NY0313808BC1" /LENGTH=185 /DNA_ID=CAMNT_0050646997 /DNA_START=91 /DNA_END=648 /DNA_ORIENTATION=-